MCKNVASLPLYSLTASYILGPLELTDYVERLMVMRAHQTLLDVEGLDHLDACVPIFRPGIRVHVYFNQGIFTIFWFRHHGK